jgi:hypothetical protein
VAQQFLGQAPAAAGGLLLLELIDQIDQVEEASPGAAANDRCGDGDAQMGFAGAADEDGVTLGIQELPVASSPTSPASMVVSAKTNLSRSLSTGDLAPPMR